MCEGQHMCNFSQYSIQPILIANIENATKIIHIHNCDDMISSASVIHCLRRRGQLFANRKRHKGNYKFLVSFPGSSVILELIYFRKQKISFLEVDFFKIFTRGQLSFLLKTEK